MKTTICFLLVMLIFIVPIPTSSAQIDMKSRDDTEKELKKLKRENPAHHLT